MIHFWKRDPLRDWIVDQLYRTDAGLFEIEKDYISKFKKKKGNKEMLKDRGYNQYLGKLKFTVCLAQDFGIMLPDFGDRIKGRIEKLK